MNDALLVLVLMVVLIAPILIAWRLVVWMPGQPYRGPISLSPAEAGRRETLREHLIELAENIGERHLSGRYEQLVEAAHFIERVLQADGYQPRRQEFLVEGRTVWNIEVERTGRNLSDEIIVVGAHYDTVPGSPGANDNGSAVVANLALAHAFANVVTERSVRFVFFVNEESPYHMTAHMGSLRYAQKCREREERIIGMISLEMLGCFRDDPGSQRYPSALLKLVYPTTGNFLAVVGNVRSRRWLHKVVAGLRETELPVEGIAAPRFLRDVFRSDHAAFWHLGDPAVMVTDTANFRYSYYHSADDTPDKINFDVLARVVTALTATLHKM